MYRERKHQARESRYGDMPIEATKSVTKRSLSGLASRASAPFNTTAGQPDG
jgi:hypothetical protein